VVKSTDSAAYKEAVLAQSRSLLSSCQSSVESTLLEGKDPVSIISEATAGYDLLITGTPKSHNWTHVLLGSGRDKFVENAACSVLRLTFNSNELIQEAPPGEINVEDQFTHLENKHNSSSI
jgi:nucleotide-binding universal stress UspA family protein